MASAHAGLTEQPLGVRRESDRAAHVGALGALDERGHLLRVGRGSHAAVQVLAGESHERAVLPELVGVGERVEGAGHSDHAEQVLQAEPARVAHHRNDRHHSGTAGHRDRRHLAGPREPAADRTAQLEHVAHPRLVVHEPRDLAVGQALHHQLKQRVVRVRGSGVGTLGGVVVRCAEPEHVVLAGQVVHPVGHLEPQPHETVGALDLRERAGGPGAGGGVRHGVPAEA